MRRLVLLKKFGSFRLKSRVGLKYTLLKDVTDIDLCFFRQILLCFPKKGTW